MEEKVLMVEMPIKITAEDVDDIMSNALDGAISYWCSNVAVVGDYLGEYASDQISRGGSLELYDLEDGNKKLLDLEKLLNGIKLWAQNPVGYNCLVQTNNKLIIDCSNADAEVCDAIVQYAIFGEIMYG